MSFTKFTLGVHKKAHNSAVCGELGRLPLGVDIIKRAFDYYQDLKQSPRNNLLRNTFLTSNSITCPSKKLDHIMLWS